MDLALAGGGCRALGDPWRPASAGSI